MLAALVGAPALSAAFWDDKQFEDWSEEEILKLLTDSPWARSMTMRLKLNQSDSVDPWEGIPVPGTESSQQGLPPGHGMGSPVGGIGAPKPRLPSEAAITVLWASALPVKQAIALSKLTAEQTLTDQARREIERSESDYVVGVYGIPAVVAHSGANLIESDIYRTARLRTARDLIMPPHSVYCPIEGAKIVITMRFSRDKPLTAQDRWVECSGSSELFQFRARFNLRQMMFEDELAL